MKTGKRTFEKVIALLTVLVMTISFSTVVAFADGGRSQTDAQNIELKMGSKNPTATVSGTTRKWASEDVKEYDYYKFRTSTNKGSTYTISVTHDGGTNEPLLVGACKEGNKNDIGRYVAPYGTELVRDDIEFEQDKTVYIWVSFYYNDGAKEQADYTIKVTENLVKPVKQSITSLKAKKKKAEVKFIRDGFAERYQIAYKKSGESKWTYKTVTTNKCVLSNLKSKKKYSVKVRGQKYCYENWVNGSWSKTKTVKVK